MRKARINILVILAAAFLLFTSCTAHNALIQSNGLSVQSADGSRIVYGVSGQGDAILLFVHGWLCDHSVWQPQIDHFSEDHLVVWLDLAGHGGSTANRRQFTMVSFAQDVKAVANEVEGKKIILVGHSMGGPIVVEAAKLLGDRVAGIVGVDAFYTPLAGVPEKAKLGFLEKLKQDYPSALAQTVNSMFTPKTDPELIESIYASMLANDQEMGVSALYECIIWNSRKSPQEIKNVSEYLYNINGEPAGDEESVHERVFIIPGAGHFISIVKPDEFNKALETVIEKL